MPSNKNYKHGHIILPYLYTYSYNCNYTHNYSYKYSNTYFYNYNNYDKYNRLVTSVSPLIVMTDLADDAINRVIRPDLGTPSKK